MSKDNEIFWADEHDSDMLEAYQKARDTFKYFWRELYWDRRRTVNEMCFAYAKVVVIEERDGKSIVEHMWISDLTFDGHRVAGMLLNTPSELTCVSAGDYVDVPLMQLSDWLYAMPADDGLKPKAYGGFTIHVLRTQMSEVERERHDNSWGLVFGDSDHVCISPERGGSFEGLDEHPMSMEKRDTLVKLLEKYPDEVEHVDERGLTFLHREVIAGNLSAVVVLLSHGVDVNRCTPTGETALQLARKLKWKSIVAVLEEAQK